MKWTNFNTELYERVRVAKSGQNYNLGALMRQYCDINSHLTLEKALYNFQVKFKPMIQ